jgi:TPR repeat protein
VSTDAVSGQADALRRAAEAGDAEAMWELADLAMAPPEPGATLFPQLGAVARALEYDGHQDARNWVQRSADAGNTHAMVVEAVLLEHPDRQRAERLAEQAADRGDTAAMLYLAGLLASDGNRVAARDWYTRLADLGDHAAMALLGEMLLDEDPQAARTWLRRAADAGIVRAQKDLARLAARDTARLVPHPPCASCGSPLLSVAWSPSWSSPWRLASSPYWCQWSAGRSIGPIRRSRWPLGWPLWWPL